MEAFKQAETNEEQLDITALMAKRFPERKPPSDYAGMMDSPCTNERKIDLGNLIELPEDLMGKSLEELLETEYVQTHLDHIHRTFVEPWWKVVFDRLLEPEDEDQDADDSDYKSYVDVRRILLTRSAVPNKLFVQGTFFIYDNANRSLFKPYVDKQIIKAVGLSPIMLSVATDPKDVQLLILDINGLLCNKVMPPKAGEPETPIPEGLEVLQLDYYKVVLRPGVREFLARCYDEFTVGFYSSTTFPNANAILEVLLTDEQKKATAFRWYRDRVRFDPAYGSGIEVDKHSTVKRLEDILENAVVNWHRRYNWYNTILCDDSQKKTRFNPNHNVVLISKFENDPSDQTLIGVMPIFLRAFENLHKVRAFAERVTDYCPPSYQ